MKPQLTLDVNVKDTQRLVAVHVRGFHHHRVLPPQEYRACNTHNTQLQHTQHTTATHTTATHTTATHTGLSCRKKQMVNQQSICLYRLFAWFCNCFCAGRKTTQMYECCFNIKRKVHFCRNLPSRSECSISKKLNSAKRKFYLCYLFCQWEDSSVCVQCNGAWLTKQY